MIAVPDWMSLAEPDQRPLHRLPAPIRETVTALRAAGIGCDYAGDAHGVQVFLVSRGSERGRLVIDTHRQDIELWPTPADPNGMPFAWGDYNGMAVAAGALEVVSRAW